MKNLRFLAPFVFALLASGLPAFAQKNDPEIKKIDAGFVDTPKYQFSGTKDKRSTPGQWLEVEVEFASKAPIQEEVTMRVHVVFNQMMAANKYFTGEVTYINVLEGPSKFGVMYIAPGSLKLVDNGKVPTANDIKEIGVELLIKGAVVHQANFKEAKNGTWWTQMQPLQGHVLNKNQTPFAPLFWDRYEQIKIEGR